jgi:hypothetical protein
MKTIEKSTLKESGDSNVILQGEKYLLVKQPDGLYYIYMRDIEIAIFYHYVEAENIWNELEEKSCKIVEY